MVTLQANETVGKFALSAHKKFNNSFAVPAPVHVVSKKDKPRHPAAAVRVAMGQQRDQLLEAAMNISDCVRDRVFHCAPIRIALVPMRDLSSTRIFSPESAHERIAELESEGHRGRAMEILRTNAMDFARQIDELRSLLR